MIKSLKNPKIKNYLKLHQKKYRYQQKMIFVEGLHLVQEALKQKLVVQILTTNANLEGILISKEVMAKISLLETPSQIVAICKWPLVKKIKDRVLVLDNLQDPGNVGTLIRSALSFGYDSVIALGIDIFNPKVIRATQGAIFGINLVMSKKLDLDPKYTLISATSNFQATPYDQIKPKTPFALILGSEGHGISQELIKKSLYQVYIPIKFESLNVASAGAILLNQYH